MAGSMAEAGDYHVELVAKDASVEVNVMDHDNKPVATAGYKGIAILSAGGKSQRIVLAPADAAKLAGKAASRVAGAAEGRRADHAACRKDGVRRSSIDPARQAYNTMLGLRMH